MQHQQHELILMIRVTAQLKNRAFSLHFPPLTSGSLLKQCLHFHKVKVSFLLSGPHTHLEGLVL